MLTTGLERLLGEPVWRRRLGGRRLALLAHPASVTRGLVHAVDAIFDLPDLRLAAAFGPQHGIKGDQQDNMMETADEFDPRYGIPAFSLYGEVRRPTPTMMASFDVMLVDLQDLGCRIYTFITTLRYLIEACAAEGKALWVLDRPNPVGRPIEGLRLRPGWESFVGAGPLPMRHGLTMGELARWFARLLGVELELEVIAMEGWRPADAPGYGWPVERSWVNPSPNAPNLSMARCYAGTVMLEGTTLSEGRGTTRPLELFGAPDLDVRRLLETMYEVSPAWLAGCRLRECWFEPTFHKHAGKLCAGVQIHVDDPAVYDHQAFSPWRLLALAFKAIRQLCPDYALWRDFPYEYERDRLAIDLINGSPLLREWVDDPQAEAGDLDALAKVDEASWAAEREDFLCYR